MAVSSLRISFDFLNIFNKKYGQLAAGCGIINVCSRKESKTMSEIRGISKKAIMKKFKGCRKFKVNVEDELVNFKVRGCAGYIENPENNKKVYIRTLPGGEVLYKQVDPVEDTNAIVNIEDCLTCNEDELKEITKAILKPRKEGK